MTQNSTVHIALVRCEFPDGTLNALPGQPVTTSHLSRGKVDLLVKMGAILPKAEWDALSEDQRTARTAGAYEAIFSTPTVEVTNGEEGDGE